MAAATVSDFKGPEGNLSEPLSNKLFYKWTFTGVGNGDTHASGLGNKISEFAFRNTGGTATVTQTDGTFLFAISGTNTSLVLYVWADH